VDTEMVASIRVPWISYKIPPKAVAKAILRGIHRKSAEVYVPVKDRALVLLNTLSARFGDWFVRFFHLEGW
jgi:hypothetical protein